MYTLIGTVKTRSARAVWMLEELGVEFTHHSVAPHSVEVTPHNPVGKVPVLLIDGEAITDSTAILTYLADKHGKLTAPAGTIARARQDSVTQFVLDEMDALIWTAARHSFILPEDLRIPAIKETLKWEYARSLNRLAARFQGPFLMGAEMTITDIIATHCLLWGTIAKLGTAEGALADYQTRMRARPAYLRAMAR